MSQDCAKVPWASGAFGRPWMSFGGGAVPRPKKCLSPRCGKPAALMTHWCSLGDTSLPRGSMLLETRSILYRVFPVQCRRLAWMSSFMSRDFTRGMLARCRWYHRVAKVCSSAYGTRRISSVTKVCSSAYGARRISSVTKVCSSAYGARCISSGVVMPRAWAGYSLGF